MTLLLWLILAALSVAVTPSAVQAADTELRIAQAVPLATPPAAPARPPQVIFADHFPGGELANTWEVANRDPDNYLVESGNLLIIARAAGGFGTDKTPNLFRLNKPIPDSNWVITLRFNVEFQTLRENLMFGLIDDAQNYLSAQLYAHSACCGYSDLMLRIAKVSGGQVTEFAQGVTPTSTAAQPIAIRLRKEGHEYRAGVSFTGQLDKDNNPVWVDTGSVTSLHPPKTFAMNAAQTEQTTGESPFHIISVTIEASAR